MKIHIYSLLLCFLLNIIYSQAQDFTDVSLQSGINFLPARQFKGISWGGIAVIDYNNDGLDDLYLPGGSTSDALYKNNGDGTFTNVIDKIGTKQITDKVVTLGVVSGDINNDGYKDLFITTFAPRDGSLVLSPNLLFLNNKDGTFKDISLSSNIGKDSVFSGAASFGDINNDGYLDLFVSNLVSDRKVYDGQLWDIHDLIWGISPDIIYLNNKDNTFTNVSEKYGLIDQGAGLACGFLDYNNDGNIDLATANDDFGTPQSVFPNKLFRNDFPKDTFVDVGVKAKVNDKNTSMGIAVGDYDENGYLDFYVTYCGRKSLFKNNGNGVFTNMAYVAGVEDKDVPISDSLNTQGNVEYTYAPYPGFVGWDTTKFDYCQKGTDSCMHHNLYIHVVEVNRDTAVYHPWPTFKYKDLDAFLEVEKDRISDFCFPLDERFEVRFGLMPLKHGTEKIVFDSDLLPTTGWGANFFDFDNDSKLDLYCANGSETPDGPVYDNTNSLYQNIGNGRFKNVSKTSGADTPWSSRGSVIFDYDNDGDEDIFVQNMPYDPKAGLVRNPHSILYRNNLVKDGYNNWLEVKLKGIKSNSNGIGAMIKAHIGFRTIIRQVDGGSSHMSISSATSHFGLGPFRVVDSLEIVWPGGYKQMVYNISVNQILNVIQDCGEKFSNTIQTSGKISLNVVKQEKQLLNFQIKSMEAQKIKLELYDSSGNKKADIIYKDLKSNQLYNFKLNTTEIKPGVYIYKFISKEGVYSNKIKI